MSSSGSVWILEWVIAAGAAACLALLLLAVALRAGASLLARWRRRAEQLVRPLVLEAVMGRGVPEEAVAARGRRGRAVERVAFSYLARVRGEGHDLLADLLQRRGVTGRLIGRSGWPSRHRRAAAASQLGLLGTVAAERQLEALASADPSPQVRIVAARGLGKTGEPAAADTLLSLPPAGVPAGVVASALLELGHEATPALRDVVADPSVPGAQRAMAADVLGLLDELTAYPELAGCLASPDPQLRSSAASALGRLGLPQAAGALLGCLGEGEDPGVRAAAARALGQLGDPRAVPALAACLAEPDYWLAHHAAAALALLGPPGQRALASAAAGDQPGSRHAGEALTLARARDQARPAAGRLR